MTVDDAATRAEIKACVLDYFEGWFGADAARMERALHPSLAKRALDGPDGELDESTTDQMIDATGRGIGRDRRPAELVIDVEIGDVYGSIASATVRSTVYREYLHLARTPAGWKIVNALYALT